MNGIIYTIILLLCMITLYLVKQKIGKQGLIIVYIGMSIISYILAFKYITLYTINLNANSITYITMLTTLYLLLEDYSPKEVKKYINLNMIIITLSGILLYLMTKHDVSLTDSIGINMKNVFGNNTRVLLAYPITTILANHLMIPLHKKIKPLYDNTFITLVTSFLAIGIIEGILYNLIGYYNILNDKTIIKLVLSTYMIRLIITVIYSIYLTILSKKKVIK